MRCQQHELLPLTPTADGRPCLMGQVRQEGACSRTAAQGLPLRRLRVVSGAPHNHGRVLRRLGVGRRSVFLSPGCLHLEGRLCTSSGRFEEHRVIGV